MMAPSPAPPLPVAIPAGVAGLKPHAAGEAVVHPLVRERALSAQEVFKDQYVRTLRWSVLGALVVLILVVLVMPEYRPIPYRLSNDAITITEIELEAPPVDEAPPRESPRQPDVVSVPDDTPNTVRRLDHGVSWGRCYAKAYAAVFGSD